MSRRRSLEKHRQSLAEISDIMNSMKTLAYMETHKLGRFLEAQQRVARSIETAAEDLLDAYPQILPHSEHMTPVYLLLGSERGFCGDFNHALLDRVVSTQTESRTASIIAVGHKLCTLLEDDPRVLLALDGAGVAEEVPQLLNRLIDILSQLQLEQGPLSLICLYHQSKDHLVEQQLLPPFMTLTSSTPDKLHSHPPRLNLEPANLLLQLTEQYLFAALHEVLFTSLMSENHQRVDHLEGAVKHLQEESTRLIRTGNVLRQEEITEEIEVILLSADNAFDPAKRSQDGWEHRQPGSYHRD